MWTCASCGTPLPENAQYCPGCGQYVATQRRTSPRAPAAAPPRPAAAPSPRAIPADELQAAVAARHELGERMEAEVVDTFLNRVEQLLDARIDARIDARLRGAGRDRRGRHDATGRIGASLGLGIPLTAIAGGIAGPVGIIAVWAGIVVLNIYYSEAERR